MIGVQIRTLYVSDLDGTLLGTDGRLTAFSRDTLAAGLGEGLALTVASARSVHSIRSLLEGLNLSLPVIEFNGAFLSDFCSGAHHFVHSLEPAVVEGVYDLMRTCGHVPFVSAFDGAADRLYYGEISNEGMRWYLEERQREHEERLRHVADLQPSLREQVVCLTAIGASAPLLDLEHAIREQYAPAIQVYSFDSIYSPSWHWVTVLDRRATKAQAIRVLREEWGLDGAELVVFGDSSNDLGMFEVADRAIAPANANNEIKQLATHVIGANTEDSVARFIQQEWQARPGRPPQNQRS